MSLKPREQRTLAEIESQLRSSDPELVVMFTRLACGDRRWASLAGRPPRRRRTRGTIARMIVLLALGAALLVAGITVAVAAVAHAGTAPATCGRYPPGSPAADGSAPQPGCTAPRGAPR